MPSETTTACVNLLVFFRIRRGTFPYGVEDDASTTIQTPTTHYTNTCVKLTIVTHLSFSERIAIANLSFYFWRVFSDRGVLEEGGCSVRTDTVPHWGVGVQKIPLAWNGCCSTIGPEWRVRCNFINTFTDAEQDAPRFS